MFDLLLIDLVSHNLASNLSCRAINIGAAIFRLNARDSRLLSRTHTRGKYIVGKFRVKSICRTGVDCSGRHSVTLLCTDWWQTPSTQSVSDGVGQYGGVPLFVLSNLHAPMEARVWYTYTEPFGGWWHKLEAPVTTGRLWTWFRGRAITGSNVAAFVLLECRIKRLFGKLVRIEIV